MTPSLPLQPADATPIASSFSWDVIGDTAWYFSNLEPFDCHAAGDTRAQALRIARFHTISGVRCVDLARAFSVSRPTVYRAVKLLETKGEAAFGAPRPPRGRTVVSPAMARRAATMLASGFSGRACARALDVSHSTFSENLRSGVIAAPVVSGAAASERSARAKEARTPAMGRACHDVGGRLLAAAGMMDEASPRFDAGALAVERGGVLAALPMLLREGLLETAHESLRLPAGFYGLSAILIMLAFMTMARVRTPERLRYQAPGEWGLLLGLDRCPEVKTLRRKVAALAASPEPVEAWQRALAGSWLEDGSQDWMTLAVDGHVKVYSGKGRVPKHFVSRQKLCLPATASYWINALSGAPLVCLHKDLDGKMVQALEHDVVPELEALGVVTGDAGDLLRGGQPAVTLVFDREGWSPELFRRLARRGIAVITWHKSFRGEDWAVEDFTDCTVPLHGPAGTRPARVRLAEKKVVLAKGHEVRQIRRLLDNGRQVPLITSHPGMAMEDVAGAMFSRWSQENFFKYMRDAYNLDALPEHGLEAVDDDALVVNPAHRTVHKAIGKNQARLNQLLVRIAKATARGKATDALAAEADTVAETLAELRQRRSTLDSHVRVGELADDDKPDTLPRARRLFVDLIRMICYRAETRMMTPVIEGKARPNTARALIAALMTANANILPDHDRGILRVSILGLASHAAEKPLLTLIDELNQTATVYPGTNLRLVYDIDGVSLPNRVN